jgi:tetratricopeptide (TPR) repeat protein
MKMNRYMTKLVPALVMLVALSGPAWVAAQDDAKDEKARTKQQEKQERDTEQAYQKAKKLVDKGQWEEAVKALDQVIKSGGARADGALYWKAYSQNRLNQQADALATLAELNKAFPESRWSGDGKALEADIRHRVGGQPPNPENQANEDLKLMAINSLMHTESDKALPMLQKLLEGNQSPKIKEKALFVLSQSGSDKAREIVANFARGKSNPELQLKSLEYIALFGGKENRQVLADVYASTDDKKIKRSLLNFYMIGGERDRLLAAAKGEKDADLRGEAINQLGVMGARDELIEMY